MDLLRIGHKLVSRARIDRRIDEILEMRVAGRSQQEVAEATGIDRSFISRLEMLGEIRKGGRVALVGFPIQNKEELERVAWREGVDYTLILTEAERQQFAANSSGAELVNHIMEISGKLRDFDTVVFLGSDMRLRMVESMIGREIVVGWPLGPSPLTSDVYVDVEAITDLLRNLVDRKGGT